MSHALSEFTHDFKPNWLLSNPHLQTITPHLFRGTKPVIYKRERFTLSDGDFVDLDWSTSENDKLCLILHGLESNSNRGYIYGMVNTLKDHGFDAVVLNNRGCSGETNKLFKSYNSGFTNDTLEVLEYLSNKKSYAEINLIGFSLGGNVALKLAGEHSEHLNRNIHKIATVSVPCDLSATAKKLQEKKNRIYHDRFLKSLKEKLLQKLPLFPNELSQEKINAVKTLTEFDDYYTARAFGFKDAEDYYNKCSSKPFLKFIKNKALIITALDDPFLTNDCMPLKEVENNENITFINPRQGGHVGFMQNIRKKCYWHENVILRFLTN